MFIIHFAVSETWGVLSISVYNYSHGTSYKAATNIKNAVTHLANSLKNCMDKLHVKITAHAYSILEERKRERRRVRRAPGASIEKNTYVIHTRGSQIK